ncbi:MAG: biopolymer transporter ExbD [Thermodesulfobacteriota bacterium]
MAVKGKERPVFLNADKRVAYGQVIKVMADVKNAGFEKLGMITKPQYDQAKK